jgi:hypothetical protein
MGTSLDAKYEEFWRQSIKQLNEVVKATGMPIAPDEKGQYSLWYDVRELRIRFSISVERIKRFFEGLREGKIYATRCRSAVGTTSRRKLTAHTVGSVIWIG